MASRDVRSHSLVLLASASTLVLAFLSAAVAQEANVSIPDVAVHSDRSEEEKAEKKLERVPGGSSLITSEEIEHGRISNPADILSKEPGVFAQSTSGGEAIRLSIRGSGIQRSPLNYLAGVSVLLDGIPITTSTGVPWELVEPLAANHVEILRGGNAFEYGAKTLGGAIDYVSHTGYDSKPFQGRVEAGSYGYWRGQLSTGGVEGPLDYYLSASGFKQDGYRENSGASSVRFIGNVGYKFTPDLETRFYFRFAHEYFQVPNTLTYAQLQANPRQAAPIAAASGWYKNIPSSIFVGNKTKLRLDEQSYVELDFAYKRFPQSGAGGPFVRWEASDVSAALKYVREDDLNGHASKSTLSILSSTAIDTGLKLEGWTNFFAAKDQLINTVRFAGADLVLLGQNELEVTPDFWLTTGLALSYSPRTSDFLYPIYNNFSKDFYNYAPRLGVRYQIAPDVQIFANASRTVEPPTNWSFPKILFPTSQLGSLDLKEQTAWTAEGGVKGKFGAFKWDLAYYYSWVNNELLTTLIPGTAVTTTRNASETRHQGVELGLDTLLWKSVLPGATVAQSDGYGAALLQSVFGDAGQQLSLNQNYTWSDFHYADDPVYGGNRLPTIPVHFYKAELEYRHPVGFYAGFNVESTFVGYPVDYANSFYSRPYAIIGAKIGYVRPKQADEAFQWETYLEGRNLANVKYASVVSATYNANGRDAAVFYPGDGIGIYGGVTLRY